MSHEIRFAPEASAELTDAARWYEERRVGLGLAFLAAVDLSVESLFDGLELAHPSLDWLKSSRSDGLPVSRFPYYTAYLVSDEMVHVLAIAHHRRRPVYWSGRAEQ